MFCGELRSVIRNKPFASGYADGDQFVLWRIAGEQPRILDNDRIQPFSKASASANTFSAVKPSFTSSTLAGAE
jgi:hypothetical protein